MSGWVTSVSATPTQHNPNSSGGDMPIPQNPTTGSPQAHHQRRHGILLAARQRQRPLERRRQQVCRRVHGGGAAALQHHCTARVAGKEAQQFGCRVPVSVWVRGCGFWGRGWAEQMNAGNRLSSGDEAVKAHQAVCASH